MAGAVEVIEGLLWQRRAAGDTVCPVSAVAPAAGRADLASPQSLRPEAIFQKGHPAQGLFGFQVILRHSVLPSSSSVPPTSSRAPQAGQEKGVRVQVTNLSSASKIGGFLKEAQKGGRDAPEMPDLFTCHISDATALGSDNLVDWNAWFTAEELSNFVPGFLADGMTEDGTLLLFPISKSTQLLMCNGSGFARFSDATGVGYDDLATWEGFYDAAGKFYDWSGKPFCALDYPIRAVELCAMERGSGDFYTENGWYDTDNAVFKESWMQFARSLAQGHVVVSDLYSNTQVMTGDVLSGLGSSAAILYYNDTVTYRDGTQEPMDLHVLPMPKTAGADALMTQAGVGLCAYKTTDQKAEAAALFVRWLTESERNLDFVAQTGYMPVRNGAFDAIENYDKFPEPTESYRQLYAALKIMQESYTPLSEPRFEGYYGKVSQLYDGLRQMQQKLPARAAAGESIDTLAEETWALLCAIH